MVSDDVRAIWDAEAATFDDEPDHGLLDPTVRTAWRRLLLRVLPPAPARILDLGCGTGSLSVLLAQMGHTVTGVDLAPRMIEQARAKALTSGVDVELYVGDAASPPVGNAFDVVLTRHVLWALPDPEGAITRWLDVLTADGRLLLIEGRWHTGAGLTADELVPLVAPRVSTTTVEHLEDPDLWGAAITDERYLLLATR